MVQALQTLVAPTVTPQQTAVMPSQTEVGAYQTNGIGDMLTSIMPLIMIMMVFMMMTPMFKGMSKGFGS